MIDPKLKQDILDLTEDRKRDLVTFQKPAHKNYFNRIVDIYTQKSHFIYELLQNAQDQKAKNIKVILGNDYLEFSHDGDVFEYKNIDSITSTGDSTKSEYENTIGKFGVGFKSVFAICDTPKIYSPTVCFEIQNMIIPVLIEQVETKNWTKFVFEFKKEEKDKIYEDLQNKLENEIDDKSILFLNSIESLEIIINETKNEINITKNVTKKDTYLLIEIGHSNANKNQESQKNYLYFKSYLEYETENIECGVCYEFEIILGKYNFKKVNHSSQEQNLYVYFPTKDQFNLSFIVNGGFVTTPNRESCKTENAFNEKLFHRIGLIIYNSILTLRDLEILNLSFLELFSNLEGQNCIYDFNSKLEILITELFKNEKIIPLEGGGYEMINKSYIAEIDLLKFFEPLDFITYYHSSLVKKEIVYNPNLIKLYNFIGDKCEKVNLINFLSITKSEVFDNKQEKWFERFYDKLTTIEKEEWLNLEIIKLQNGKFAKPSDRLYFHKYHNSLNFDYDIINQSEYNLVDEIFRKKELENFVKYFEFNFISEVVKYSEILRNIPQVVYKNTEEELTKLYHFLIYQGAGLKGFKILKLSNGNFCSSDDAIYVAKKSLDVKINFDASSVDKFILKPANNKIYDYILKNFEIDTIGSILHNNPDILKELSDSDLQKVYRFLLDENEFKPNFKLLKLDNDNFCSPSEKPYLPTKLKFTEKKCKVLNQLFLKSENLSITKDLQRFFELKQFDEFENIKTVIIPSFEEELTNDEFKQNLDKLESYIDKLDIYKLNEISDLLKSFNIIPVLDWEGDSFRIKKDNEFYEFVDFNNKYYLKFAKEMKLYMLDSSILRPDSVIITLCNNFENKFELFQIDSDNISHILEEILSNFGKQRSQDLLFVLNKFLTDNPNKVKELISKYQYLLNTKNWLVDKDNEQVKPDQISFDECGLDIFEKIKESGILHFKSDKISRSNIDKIKNIAGEDVVTKIELTEGMTPEEVRQATEDFENKKKKDEENERLKQEKKERELLSKAEFEANVENLLKNSTVIEFVPKNTDSKKGRNHPVSIDVLDAKNKAEYNARQEIQRVIGNKGEIFAYYYLCKEFGNDKVNWLNEKGDQNGGYDIEVEMDDDTTYFYEVKAKINKDPRSLRITWDEWKKAEIEKDNFFIFIYTLNDNRVEIIKNPYQKWIDNMIKVNPLNLII